MSLRTPETGTRKDELQTMMMHAAANRSKPACLRGLAPGPLVSSEQGARGPVHELWL